MLLPLTNAQRCARFGRFNWEPASGDNIAISSRWIAENIVRVYEDDIPPELSNILAGRSVRIHRLAAPSFIDLWQAWDKAGLLQHVHTWNGSFVPRFKRGAKARNVAALSNHSWGTAFDINAQKYPLGRKVPTVDIMHCMADIAEEHGWFWGGNFRSRPDGMHFEYTAE